jgi:hypothetical protein
VPGRHQLGRHLAGRLAERQGDQIADWPAFLGRAGSFCSPVRPAPGPRAGQCAGSAAAVGVAGWNSRQVEPTPRSRRARRGALLAARGRAPILLAPSPADTARRAGSLSGE